MGCEVGAVFARLFFEVSYGFVHGGVLAHGLCSFGGGFSLHELLLLLSGGGAFGAELFYFCFGAENV